MDGAAQGRASTGMPTGASAPANAAAGGATGGWVTPDGVELDVAIATVGSRGIAYLIDFSLIATGLLLISFGQELFGFAGFVPGWFGIAVLLLAAFTLQFAYPIGFEVLWRGRTLGKAAMGLRVVTQEGSPVGFRHSAVRAVLGLIDLAGSLGLVAMISSVSSSRGQRLGDLAAGTIVVRERRISRGPLAMSYPTPQGYEGYVSRMDVTNLDSRDRAALRDTLRRLPSLPDRTREQVLVQLAQTLSGRVMPPAPADMPAELWLRCVAAASDARSRASTPVMPAPTAARASSPPGPPGYPGSSPPPMPPPAPQASPPTGPPNPERSRDDTGFAPPA